MAGDISYATAVPSSDVAIFWPGTWPDLREAIMKETSLTELAIDTWNQFFYGGMTSEEHEEQDFPSEEVCAWAPDAEISGSPG